MAGDIARNTEVGQGEGAGMATQGEQRWSLCLEGWFTGPALSWDSPKKSKFWD